MPSFPALIQRDEAKFQMNAFGSRWRIDLLDHYTLISRDNVWWVLLDGTRTGPFASRLEAARSAIGAGDVRSQTGQNGDVSVENGKSGWLIIYSTVSA